MKDIDDEWTVAIDAAHPTRTGGHDKWAVAMQMVGNRHSKGALVELVNWLLARGDETVHKAKLAQDVVDNLAKQGMTAAGITMIVSKHIGNALGIAEPKSHDEVVEAAKALMSRAERLEKAAQAFCDAMLAYELAPEEDHEAWQAAVNSRSALENALAAGRKST